IVAHELCHVRRRDNLTSLAHMAVEVLFWFHPVVWWLGSRLVSERERACDEEVIEMGADKQSYAESILKVCGFCLRAPAGMSGVGSSHLSTRIERIMTRGLPAPLNASARVLIASVAALIVSAPLATGVLNAHRESPAAQDGRQVYKVGGDVKAPKMVYEVKP